MAYYGQDWRQPGDLWVRTTEGWEKLQLWRFRLLENLNENVTERRKKLTGESEEDDFRFLQAPTQPHVLITKGTKERKIQTTLSEAFNRLDMLGAAKDRRRCNYVANVLKILIQDKLSKLSGAGQKMVFCLLEEMIQHAVKNETNIGGMYDLLDEAERALMTGHYTHVGSSALWKKHTDNLHRLRNMLNTFQYTERENDGKVTLSDLPDDCVRHILKRLSNHKDIVHTGLTDSRTLGLTQEMLLWRELCIFHFENRQICSVLKKDESLTTIDWQLLYKRLVKRYGMRDIYIDQLYTCNNCAAAFWQPHGHPCLCPDLPPASSALSPADFLNLFDI